MTDLIVCRTIYLLRRTIMALRIRKNGKILCAALNKEKKDDLYVGDGLHYFLSVKCKVLVTEPWELHKKHKGQWWFTNKIPKKAKIDPFYLN